MLETIVNTFQRYYPLYSPTFDVTIEGVDCSFNVPVKISSEESCKGPPSNFATMTRCQQRAPSASSNSSLQVYAKKTTVHCKRWCSCSCHKKNVVRLKQPFQSNKGGYITFAYGGLPWITAECDEKKTCSSRSLPYVATTIHFPAWFWKRYVSTSLTFNALDGPNIFFKMPRSVDWTPKLWKFAQEGNVRAVRDLFDTGAASAFDVSPIGGSALHFAAGNRHLELCQFLVSRGALADHEDDFKK